MKPDADDLLADLVQALLDEESARGSAREARSRQAEALRGLQAAGVRLGVVAHRIARARGVVLPIGERIRLGERLRKRASRAARDVKRGLEVLPAKPALSRAYQEAKADALSALADYFAAIAAR